MIVNQVRMLADLRDHMQRSPSRLAPFYGLRASDVAVDTSGSSAYPVTVTVRQAHEGAGGDRHHLDPPGQICRRLRRLAQRHPDRDRPRATGDATNQSWGVMDVLAVTDFPDIRVKCAISSANQGNILIIPREGGYLARIYIELDEVTDGEMLDNQSVTPEQLANVANRILHPYTIEVKDVGWWSVYQIGQRLCDKFDDVPAEEMATRLPRVFIAGDACHTHSAKAGQGMNVSMADAWNLGWKLASVLRGTAKPELLHTYSEERQTVAKQLIDFDREFSDRFRARTTRSGDADGTTTTPRSSSSTSSRRPLHRGSGDQLCSLDDHRRCGFPGPRRRVPGRDALPLCAGRPAGRRQTDPPGPRRAGGRRLARLRVRRPRPTRPAGALAPGSCASSWHRTRPRSNASRPRVPSPTR